MKKTIVLTLPLLLVACHVEVPEIEPVYEGCATDENWVTFDDYIRTDRLSTAPQTAPQWLEPAESAALDVASAPTFRFQPSATIEGSPNGDAVCPQFSPSSRSGISPQHLPAVSGTVFDVLFTLEDGPAYRVITTRQSVRLRPSLWKSWAGHRVTVTLNSARLLRNEVMAGPYRAPLLVFDIAQ